MPSHHLIIPVSSPLFSAGWLWSWLHFGWCHASCLRRPTYWCLPAAGSRPSSSSAPVSEDRTPRRTHVFLSLVVSRMPEHIQSRTRVCGSRLDDSSHRSCVLSRRASKITPPHSMFHKTLLDVPDTFSSLFSSPSQTTPTTRPLTGIRSTPCATSPEGSPSGYLAETLPHSGYEPNTCIDVSSEHTLINYPSRRYSFNTDNNDITTSRRPLI